MADLGFTCRVASTTGGGAGVNVDKLSLVRTGTTFMANTSLDINSPGAGWSSEGGPVSFSSTEFMEVTQVYRNGVLQLPGINSAADNDVYFVSASGTLAFEYDIRNLDVLQVWNFTTTSSG
jgi:hypothetical protein